MQVISGKFRHKPKPRSACYRGASCKVKTYHAGSMSIHVKEPSKTVGRGFSTRTITGCLTSSLTQVSHQVKLKHRGVRKSRHHVKVFQHVSTSLPASYSWSRASRLSRKIRIHSTIGHHVGNPDSGPTQRRGPQRSTGPRRSRRLLLGAAIRLTATSITGGRGKTQA